MLGKKFRQIASIIHCAKHNTLYNPEWMTDKFINKKREDLCLVNNICFIQNKL